MFVWILINLDNSAEFHMKLMKVAPPSAFSFGSTFYPVMWSYKWKLNFDSMTKVLKDQIEEREGKTINWVIQFMKKAWRKKNY